MLTIFAQSAHRSTGQKLLSALALCALADFLFFDQRYAGWTLGIFVIALLLAMMWHNTRRLDTPAALLVGALIAGQSIALIIAPNALSVWLCACGFFVLCAMRCGIYKAQITQWAVLFLRMGCYAIVLPLSSAMKWLRIRKRRNKRIDLYTLLRNWLLPVVAGLVFLSIFSGANPLVQHWMHAIRLHFVFDWLDEERVFFWLLLSIPVWMAVRPRVMAHMHPRARATYFTRTKWIQWLFSPAAIWRGLLVFNVLFASQTALDVAYLWSGLALPTGFNYADYAQRGAYSLICAAVLAAVFVLVALRDGSDSAQNPLVRGLVYLWIGQNILLVFSAMQRLSLYVEVYSLTYLRVAAFVWMALVACGLVLIIMRIVHRKSGTWLVSANVTALLGVMYVCSFANIGGYIAQFNVSHSKGMKGGERVLDSYYLFNSVGLPALPALQRYLGQGHMAEKERKDLETYISTLHRRLNHHQNHWRSWSLRDYWLALEVANTLATQNKPRYGKQQ